VSGRLRSCLISEGILGVMIGAACCPSEGMLDKRRALRSSVTFGEPSLPSQTISWLPMKEAEPATYDYQMTMTVTMWLQLKIENDEQYWEASNRGSSVVSLASGVLLCPAAVQMQNEGRRGGGLLVIVISHKRGNEVRNLASHPAGSLAGHCPERRWERSFLSLSSLLYYHELSHKLCLALKNEID
jgi:hypothetical protein